MAAAPLREVDSLWPSAKCYPSDRNLYYFRIPLYDRHDKNKTSLTVPAQIQRRAGIKTGDRVEFRVSGGIINIIPSLPSADDEYTPAERRIIDAGIAEGRKGPYYGPFKNGAEVAVFLKEWKSKRKPAKPKKTG